MDASGRAALLFGVGDNHSEFRVENAPREYDTGNQMSTNILLAYHNIAPNKYLKFSE